MIVGSGILAAALLMTLGLLAYLAQMDREQTAGLRQNIAQLNRRLREPQNATVLERSVFINDLIFHKSVSWSRLFSDLEKTVPYDVKVMTLHPSVNARNQVMLDMTVGAEKPEAIERILQAFEKSPIFGPVYQHNTLAPSQAEPLYRSRITVPYQQKL
jgi:type IV pilus assembly protein PilN